MTRDEVIKGLELCITPDPADCADCLVKRIVTLRPYSIDNYGELWTLYLRRPD